MKILITGISGFLGRNLISRLGHHELFGLDIQEDSIGGISVFSSIDLDKLDLDIDIVIICHAAVASGTTILSNDILYEVNVSLTEKIINKFKEAFIIYVSTASVYDIDLSVIQENSEINPQSDYALSKFWSERIISKNKKSTIIRLSSLYGIGMKENTLIPNYINQSLQENIIHVWGKGNRRQNYVHVSDVANYVFLIIENQQKLYGKLLLGVSKEEYSNLEMAKIISDITKAKIIFVNEDYSKSFCYNNDYTTELLDWKPEINISERLQNYIEWKQRK